MISIVMATFNGSRYIIQQLESIRNQSIKPDEVLIFDDGSTDDTVQLVDQYIHDNKLKEWKIEKNSSNKGFFYNFIDGICKTNGDTIYLADQDDIWDLNRLLFSEKIFKNKPTVFLVESNIQMIDANGVKLPNQENYHGISSKEKQIILSTEDMCRFAGSGFTMGFRGEIREALIKNYDLFTEENFKFHDILVGLLAASMGTCVLDREITDSHRLHENNATKKKDKSYVSNRTKSDQLDILTRRGKYFKIIAEFTKDESKQQIFNKFSSFSNLRKSYIERFSLNDFRKIARMKNMYMSRYGLITDTLYSLGFEKELIWLMRKSNK